MRAEFSFCYKAKHIYVSHLNFIALKALVLIVFYAPDSMPPINTGLVNLFAGVDMLMKAVGKDCTSLFSILWPMKIKRKKILKLGW